MGNFLCDIDSKDKKYMLGRCILRLCRCFCNIAKRLRDKISYDLDLKVKIKGKKAQIIDSSPKLHIKRLMRNA